MSRDFKTYFSITSGPFLLPFFIAFLLTSFFLQHADLQLVDFPREMIGVATLHGIDIDKRVNLLYYGLGMLTLSFFTVNRLITVLHRNYTEYLPSTSFLNGLSALGILLVLSIYFSPTAESSLNLLLSVLVLAFVFFGSKSVGNKALSHDESNTLFAEFLLVTAAITILLRDVVVIYFNVSRKFYLNEQLIVIGSLLILTLTVINARRDQPIKSFGRILLLVCWIPLLSVLTREVSMILDQRQWMHLSPAILLPLLSLVLVTVFSIAKKRIYNSDSPSIHRAAMVFFFGIITYAYYTPVIEQPTEMFELANPVLGLERFFKYGEVPLLETFNSHLLFELFFGFVYTLFNGYGGLDFLTYDFLHVVLYFVILFYFFNKWLDNRFLVIAMLLFYPVVQQLIPLTFGIILLMIFVFDQWYRNDDFRYYFLLLSSLAGLILWKIDFGYAALLAIVVLTAVLHIAGMKKIHWVNLAKALAWMIVPVVIVILYCLATGIPIWHNLQQALHYLSSTQTYGYEIMTIEYDNLFFVHYLFFPLVIWIILICILFRLKTYLAENQFHTLSMLFLIFYYFANFHRGIVRHGFMENTDQWLSSFAFFIIPGIIFFVRFSEKWRPYKSYIFLGIVFLLLMAFDFPQLRTDRITYTAIHEKFLSGDTIETSEERIIGKQEFLSSHIEDLQHFMDQYTSEHETFYDYSNTPMLYYYLDKPVPSYFNQMLLSMHDEFLQQCIIDSLKKGHIPFVIHDNFPETWYDNQDGVPKDLRHYHLGEYMHRNYAPLAIVGNHVIWKNNEVDAKLEMLSVEPVIDTTENSLVLKLAPEDLKQNRLEIMIETKASVYLKTQDSTYKSNYNLSDRVYFLLDKSDLKEGEIKIVGRTGEIKRIEITNCNYFPDRISQQVRTYDLRYLPQIWAENFTSDNFSFTDLHLIRSKNVNVFNVSLLDDLDKSQGNFLLLEGYSPDKKLNNCIVNFMADSTVLGTFKFILSSPDKNGRYLIRISSQYLWNRSDVNRIEIVPDFYTTEINKVSILTPVIQKQKPG